MVGDVTAVAAQSEIFTRVRRDPVNGGDRQVDVEEACSALMRFEDGALGVFETAKVCPSRPCDFTLEVSGSLGTLRFEYPRLNELWYGSADAPPELYGMVRIRAEHPAHPETAGWWPIGQGIGYGASFVNQAADLLAAVARRRVGSEYDDGAEGSGGLRGDRASVGRAKMGGGIRGGGVGSRLTSSRVLS